MWTDHGNRHINLEIGTEAAHPEQEYINGISVAVRHIKTSAGIVVIEKSALICMEETPFSRKARLKINVRPNVDVF